MGHKSVFNRLTVLLRMLATLLVLSGCVGPKYNEKVLCEKRGGSKVLQFIQYEQSEYPNMPQFGGHSILGGVYFKDEDNWGRNRWLFEGAMDDWEEYAKDGCKSSSIDGDNIVLHPLHRQYDIRGEWLELNRAIVSTDGGRGFDLVYFSQSGPPYLRNSSSDLLSYPRWISKKVVISEQAIMVEQVTMLTAPFKFGDKRTGKDIWPWLTFKGGGCNECEPLIARTLVSFDKGKSWSIESFSVIKPEIVPADAALPLDDRRMYWFNPKGGPNGTLVDCPADASTLAEWPRKVCTLSDSMVIPLD